jgi:GNAT superfamily N-acetyltransferase
MTLEIRPVTADFWADLAIFFGKSGAFSNCWCTWWRQTSAEFSDGVKETGAGNRSLMHEIVESGAEPGLLAYRDGKPVGWISVAPRPQYGRIMRSRRIGPDPDDAMDEAIWSVVCFWIPRSERGKGVANELLSGAIERARERGARLLEAYPVDTASGRKPAAYLFTGTLTMFERAGFHEVARPRGAQLVMRRDLRIGLEPR